MTTCPDSFYYSFFASNRQPLFRFLLWTLLVGILGLCSPALAFQGNCPVGSMYYQSNPVLCVGGSVTLGAPTGTGYTYQWFRNTSPIAGATNSTYTTSQEGGFVVAVTANGCTIAFGPLSVSYLQASISPSGPQSLCSGGNLVLKGSGSGAPTGYGTFQYFWMKDNVALNSGAPLPDSYSVTQTGTYYVRVFFNGCYVSSNSVVVSAQSGTPPTISIRSSATSFCAGSSLTLSAVGSGTYQWYKDNVALPGATAATYSATAAGVYHCVLNPGGCSVTSNQLTLTTGLTAGSTISFGPQTSPTICTGGSVVINGTAGTNFTNQWQKNGLDIPGATGNTYTATQAGSYRVVFTNNGCQTTIGSVLVTVLTVPVATITVEGKPAFGQGGDITLTAPSGTDYSYQWKRNAVNIPGATLRSTKANSSGSYTVEVRNGPCSAVSAAQVVTINDNNYVITNLITKSGVTTASQINTLLAGEIQQSISYLDDLGRPIQSIITQGSPTKQDIISFTVLDQLGRQPKAFLPYTGGSNGQYQSDPTTAQSTFFLANKADNKAFAESRFESSPLGRVVEQGAPGTAWQLAATPEEGRTQKLAYGTNVANEIRIWNYNLSTKVAIGTTFYPANALSFTQATDEHGLKMREYKDKSGKVICKKVQQILNDETSYVWTYYVYDDFSNLRFQIPRAAVNKLSTINYSFTYNDIFCQTWLYAYQYDDRFRLTEKSVPGGAITFYVYDPMDRVVLSQDPSERAVSRWMFTKYDLLGRIIMAGRYKNVTSKQVDMQGIVDKYYIDNPTRTSYESRSATDFTNLHGYSNQSFPQLLIPNSADSRPLAVSYYEDYDFNYNGIVEETDKEEPKFIPVTGFSVPTYSTRGMATGQRTWVLDKDIWLTSATYYDSEGQVIQSQIENYNTAGIVLPSKGVTLDVISMKYSFDGKVINTERQHGYAYSDNSKVLTIKNEFVYDHAGRVKESYMQINNEAKQTLAVHDYNEVGEVKSKSLGTSALQKVDYTYNIRGWLKTINEGILSGTDIFAMSYTHQEGGNTPQYNGNMAKYDWISKTDAIRRTYQFTYDGLNRLKAADYTAVNASNVTMPEAFSVNNLTYDANGNILTLNRQNLVKRNSNAVDQFDYVDKLQYNYYDGIGNKLKWVEDASLYPLAESSDFPNLSNKATNPIEYNYDSEGRLTTDLNKGITNVIYNDRDLPSTISLGSKGYISHTYDASGTKLQMEVNSAGKAAVTTKYFDGIVYLDNVIQSIETPEGRALSPQITGESEWIYEYNYRDHLGNLRVAFRKGTGTITKTATMDDAVISPEWSNTSGAIRNNERAANGSNSAKLTPANPIGPWKTIKVNKGDQITVKAQGKYVEAATNNTTAVNLTTYVNGLPAQTSESKNSPRMLSLGLTISPEGVNTNSGSIPKAYLEYILQNSDEKGIARRRTYVTTKASTTYGPDWEVLEMTYSVEEDGYLQVLVVNESDKPVWFDNVTIKVTPGITYQETHYDPWGLELAGIEDRGNPENEYKFQGKELIDELALYWQDFEARYYDPQLGRWHTGDPADQFGSPYLAMGNSPAMYADPDGRWVHIVIGAAFGGIVNVVMHGDKIKSGKDLIVAFGIGALAGGITAATGGMAAASAGLSVSTVAGGAFAGAVGSVYGSMIQGAGNSIYFNEPYTGTQYLKDVIIGGVVGGAIGGVAGWLKNLYAAKNGLPTSNVIWGDKPIFGRGPIVQPGELTLAAEQGAGNWDLNYTKNSKFLNISSIDDAAAAASGSGTNSGLPAVVKAVNSNLPHAVQRGVERGVFATKAEASTMLKDLTNSISKNGFPSGAFRDPSYLDRVLVPIGNGGLASYQVAKNGTAAIKTVLIAR